MHIEIALLTGTGISGEGVERTYDICDASLRELIDRIGLHNLRYEPNADGSNHVTVNAVLVRDNVDIPTTEKINLVTVLIADTVTRLTKNREERIQSDRDALKSKLGDRIAQLMEEDIQRSNPTIQPVHIRFDGIWFYADANEPTFAEELKKIA